MKTKQKCYPVGTVPISKRKVVDIVVLMGEIFLKIYQYRGFQMAKQLFQEIILKY